MNRKLTLSMNENIIQFIHGYTKKMNSSISKIVENYFLELMKREENKDPADPLGLCGVLKHMAFKPDKKGIRRMFHEDHLD